MPLRHSNPTSSQDKGKRYQLIIHAGLPKTGTSSIQVFLDDNARKLQEQGFYYTPAADPVGRPNHNLLALAFWSNVQRSYRRIYGHDQTGLQQASLNAWRDLKEGFVSSGCETLILSGEFFTGCRTRQLADFLSNEFSNFDIASIFYLRRPSEYFASISQQHIKGSNHLKPIARSRRSEKLSQWSKLGDIIIREFNRDTLVGGDVSADFARAIGLRDGELNIPRPQNETISAEGMELLLMHRRFLFPEAQPQIFPKSRQLIRKIQKLERSNAETFGFTRPRLHDEFAKYLDLDLVEVDALDEKFGFRFSALDYSYHIADDAALEKRRFMFVGDQMPYDTELKNWLQYYLEQEGTKFSHLHGK